ncbi:MAG: hypothetical protein SWO11_21330 [Thermodesulfobacteriota bacterium]|nr:hypothetical protein [Thermodesulfobacteriota bacterium]
MVMQVKSNENKNAELPWNVDRFVSEDNTPDRDEPKDLEELRVRSPRYITALKDGAANPRLEQLDKEGTWMLELGDDFMMGRSGREMKMLPRAEVERETYAEIKPGIPKWSGITYHTKVSSPQEKQLLTRISGKKVIPHGYIFGDDDRQVYYPSGYPWRAALGR